MRVSPAEIGAPLWRRQLHEGPVTSVVLDAEERVITGGTDRSVCVAPVAGAQPDAAAPVERLQLTLRCQNVRFDGVRTEREQAKLREYAQYLPAGYRILSVRTTHGSGEPGASPLF